MEYWEFLLQKEGDRNWQPIHSKTEIAAGRYRLVAHSSRTNTDVEICIIYQSSEEIPPKRRSQKRSRRTNPEGLMVVIPFTYLRPGLWELRCCGDIMSDFLGLSWQQSIQLVVVSHSDTNTVQALPFKPTAPLLEAAKTDHQTPSSEHSPATSDCEITVEVEAVPTPIELPAPIPLAAPTAIKNDIEVPEPISLPAPVASQDDENSGIETEEEVITSSVPTPPISVVAATPLPLAQPDVVQQDAVTDERQTPELVSHTVEEWENLQSAAETSIQPELPFSEVPLSESDEAQPLLSPTTAEVATPLESALSNEPTGAPADSSAQGSITSSNPILDQSLQMLEQILQQVLEPVMQEFEQPEPIEPLIPSEAEQPLDSDIHQQGLLLTLDEESLVTRRGESLTISGHVDVLDVNQWGASATSRDGKTAFQGNLRYELRDPQTSRVLLDVQQPLAEQPLPIAFSHALDIPSDCKTRLILGKVTLYGSTSTPLATQPFTVTADLEELLGAIIPETRAMPFAKVLVSASDSNSFEDELGNLPQASVLPPQPRVLDLVDINQSRSSFSLKPSSKSPLPPQIYQPTSNPKTSKKSLQLPKLPKLRPITTTPELSVPLSEGEQVEPQQTYTGDLLLQQILADDVATVSSRSLAGEQETAQKWQPQEAMPQSDNVTAQSGGLEVAEAFTNHVDALEGYDSSVPIAEFPFNSVSSEDDIAEADAFAKGTEASKALETTEDEELPAEPAQALSQEIDAWALEVYSDDASLENLDTIQSKMQSTEVSPSGDLVSEPAVDEVNSESVAVGTPTVPEPKLAAQQVSQPTVDNAFQSLLQDRFWSRLNSLATDAGSSDLLQPELSPAPNSAKEEGFVIPSEPERAIFDVEEVTQPLTSNTLLTDFDETMWGEESGSLDGDLAEPDPLQSPPIPENTVGVAEVSEPQSSLVDITPIDWSAQEFVVDDDEEMLPPGLEQPRVQPVVGKQVSAVETPNPQPQPQPQPPRQREILLPRRVELPVPAPELSIPTNELAAGEPVTVRVNLPPHPARLCVKLWVQDRQSRYILDGPRWLMDLIPDRSGEQEALTQLTVPFGSVEIRFEAIAVDIDSQRESHKVALDCVVVPPDLPDLSLDEFES